MQSPSDDRSADDDTEWQFGLDEVGEDAETTDEPELPPLEPGDPSLENAMFVLLGVVGTLLIFVSL
ncbi:hypothetical protein SAMN04487948_102394 [Halogranum amylolyticum]|uniref:DUF7312 domain-containing protein n=1 Tax=Halogranum amylolyticum TaxID=660520 RepID=A0A1H8PMH0_9EURY|nr:hypothetical protein [Halogranum amylolyticum]SEO43172.1 hypothetical protein SAMN04487948_102394 [Halogranum amylolyticum]